MNQRPPLPPPTAATGAAPPPPIPGHQPGQYNGPSMPPFPMQQQQQQQPQLQPPGRPSVMMRPPAGPMPPPMAQQHIAQHQQHSPPMMMRPMQAPPVGSQQLLPMMGGMMPSQAKPMPGMPPPVPVGQPPMPAGPQILSGPPLGSGMMNNGGGMTGGMDQLTQKMSTMNTATIAPGLIGAKSPVTQIRGPSGSFPVGPGMPFNDFNYSRSTLGKIPRNSTLLGKLKIPLAVTVSPYPKALRGKEEESVPLANSASTLSQIVRCRRCRSYLNPYVEMLDQGTRWKCNLCFVPNDFPPNFDFDPASNSYVDRSQKVELKHPIYEFIAPVEYMVRPPQPPAYLFVFDVSWSSVSTGFLAVCSRVVLDSLDLLPNDHGRTKVGFIGVDSHLHYFSFNPDLQTQVVSDVMDEQSVPFTENVMVNLLEKRQAIGAFLEKLPSIFKSTQKPHSCVCAALDSANRILAPNGGKVVCLLSTLGSLPTGNDRALKSREDPKARGKDSALLSPCTTYYKMLATEASKNQVCFDMFIAPPAASPDNPLSVASGYVDAATLGSCTRYTGGRFEYYPGFNAASNGDLASKFAADLSAFLSGDVGLEAVIRVRATQGITFNNFYGSFFLRSADLLALPNINLDNSYTAVGTIDEALPVPFACIQTAVLFTSSQGERKIRVINTALPVVDNYKELFEAVDCNAVADVLAKMAADRLLKGGNKYEDVRDWVMKQAVDMLVAYRSSLGMGNNPQLQVCESLRPLPLLMLALSKSIILSPEPVPIDLRAAKCLAVLQGSVEDNMHSLVPYFASIGDWLLSKDNPDTALLPTPLPLSSEHLDRSGVFLLYDGASVSILVGGEAPLPLREMLGGEQLFSAGYSLGLPNIPSRLRGLIRRLSGMHATNPMVLLIADSAARERFLFTARLIEDKGPMELPSYSNWLLSLRDKSNQ